MSFTVLAKSCAYSWKMSFDGHVDWNRMLMGPVCPFEIIGAASAAAPAAPARNLRRGGVGGAAEATWFFRAVKGFLLVAFCRRAGARFILRRAAASGPPPTCP